AGARYTRSGDINRWAGLGTYQPGIALFGLIFFLSLAGIPPLAGWYAKLVMFSAAIGGGSIWTAVLAAIAALNAVVAFYYYARVVKAMWFDPVPEGFVPGDPPQSRSLQLAMVIAGVFVIVAGIYPPISAYFGDTVASIITGG
ncbi:MAG: proton-conducting transporter membrane subunit, partial [Acidimicrobiia bacterium]|nr:proton-conducting transporter membrane subunit [Acidimicrobiia bacterium]